MAVSPPYFPFYVKDFVADDKVQSMTTEEVGAYTLLLCFAWQQRPAASIPDDDSILSRITRLGAERWAVCKVAVLTPFMARRDGRLYQPRLEEEWNKAVRLFEARSRGGRKASEKKVQESYQESCQESCQDTPISGSGSCSESSLGVSYEGVGEKKGGEKCAADDPLSPESLAQYWCFHLKRRRHGAPADSVYDVTEEFRAWIEAWADPAKIKAEMERKDRDESEHRFELKMRVFAGLRKTKADPYEGMAEKMKELRERKAAKS